jgi:hypothetical protein
MSNKIMGLQATSAAPQDQYYYDAASSSPGDVTATCNSSDGTFGLLDIGVAATQMCYNLATSTNDAITVLATKNLEENSGTAVGDVYAPSDNQGDKFTKPGDTVDWSSVLQAEDDQTHLYMNVTGFIKMTCSNSADPLTAGRWGDITVDRDMGGKLGMRCKMGPISANHNTTEIAYNNALIKKKFVEAIQTLQVDPEADGLEPYKIGQMDAIAGYRVNRALTPSLFYRPICDRENGKLTAFSLLDSSWNDLSNRVGKICAVSDPKATGLDAALAPNFLKVKDWTKLADAYPDAFMNLAIPDALEALDGSHYYHDTAVTGEGADTIQATCNTTTGVLTFNTAQQKSIDDQIEADRMGQKCNM